MTAMGISFREIAAELDINRTTVYRWRKLPPFSEEVSRLVDAAKEESTDRVVRDISEIKDIVLSTLLDVAQYDDSGSARVSAARVLTEMVQKAEERSSSNNVMRDQSEEIKGLPQSISAARFVSVLFLALLICLSLISTGEIEAQQLGTPASSTVDSDVSAEIAFWNSVRSTTNPLELEAYLIAYPNGRFAPLAKVRLKVLKKHVSVKNDSPQVIERKSEKNTIQPRESEGQIADKIPPVPPALKDTGYIGVELKTKPSPEWDKNAGRFEIVNISDFGTASKSDLKIGDIVISANERRFKNLSGFVQFLFEKSKGSKVDLVVRRSETRKIVVLEIGSKLEILWNGAHNKKPHAMALLGNAYAHGTLINKDFDKALLWLKRSADTGHIIGLRLLAVLYNNRKWSSYNPAKAMQYFMRAGDNKDSYSLYTAAGLYEKGAAGVDKDLTKAYRLYKKAAKNNHSLSQYAVGRFLYFGTGITKNDYEAAQWLTKAAEADNSSAQHLLGYMYGVGQGVEKNEKQTIELYRKSAKLGNQLSMYNLGNRYMGGRGVAKDLKKAAMWLERAAKAGSIDSLSGLGWMHRYGKGGKKKSIREAVRLYRAAADKGNAYGQYNMGILYEKGDGVPKNRAKALRYYRLAQGGTVGLRIG